MVFQDLGGKAAERRLDGLNLADDIDAVLLAFDHFHNPVQMPPGYSCSSYYFFFMCHFSPFYPTPLGRVIQ
jgi:hypothetical protein